MNALINHNQIEVFSTCDYLIEESLNYKFAIDKQGKVTSKPVDGKDHGITALEFIVVDLPHNLKELKLKSYLPTGKEIVHDKQVVREKKPVAYNPLEAHNDYITNTDNYYTLSAYSMDMDPEEDDEASLGAYIGTEAWA